MSGLRDGAKAIAMWSKDWLRAWGEARKCYKTGTHRLISPAETLDRVRPLIPILGITRIANITGLDVLGVPVVMVCRPNARSLSVSQGKGLDLLAAKASGLMEAVEAYHAEHIMLPVKLATHNEMRRMHRLVDVDALAGRTFSPFHSDLRLLWIEGFDLLQDGPVWLPYELVHMDYTLPFPAGSGCFATSSNGLASGNHVLEAISHGICEVVERDAYTLWHARKHGRSDTRLDLSSIDDEGCGELLARFASAGVVVAAWETTSDIGIPSFLCTIFDEDPASWRASYPCSGSGCHPAREVALLRALCEAAQTRLTMIAGSRDDTSRGEYLSAGNPSKLDELRSHLTREQPRCSFRDAPSFASGSFEEDVAWLLQRLRSAHCPSAVAIDLTPGHADVSVVRIVVPGLEPPHDLPGYRPGPRARLAMASAKAA